MFFTITAALENIFKLKKQIHYSDYLRFIFISFLIGYVVPVLEYFFPALPALDGVLLLV